MSGDDEVRKARAARLRRARKQARLTQAGLAARLGKSQTFVCHAETGVARVSERYVQLVLAACKLPARWGAPKRQRRDHELEPSEIAGLDPETLELVRRGSRRDKELGRKFVWWSNRPVI